MRARTEWRRLIGIYDSDAGLLGELAYLGGRLLGVAHCSLCEITHGPTGEKPAFRRARHHLGSAFATLHRNEQPTELRALTEGKLPCVVGETDAGYEIVIGAAALEACRGDVTCLEEALHAALGSSSPEGRRADAIARD